MKLKNDGALISRARLKLMNFPGIWFTHATDGRITVINGRLDFRFLQRDLLVREQPHDEGMQAWRFHYIGLEGSIGRVVSAVAVVTAVSAVAGSIPALAALAVGSAAGRPGDLELGLSGITLCRIE